MSKLTEKLIELKELYAVDKTFLPTMHSLRQKNQSNIDTMEWAPDSISRCLSKKIYLEDMATGLKIEAEYMENSVKMFEILEELFQEGGLLDQLNQSEKK